MDSLPPPPPKKHSREKERIEKTLGKVNEKRKSDTPRPTAAQRRKEKKAQEKHEAKLAAEKARIEREAKALDYLKKKKQPKVIDPEVLASAPDAIQDEVKKTSSAFKPNSPIQEAFLSSSEHQVLFGGGRGSGKTEAFIADPLAHVHNPKFRALVIRRTMPELRELIDRSMTMYKQFSPTVQWRGKENMFIFPSGAKIEYGYLDSESDLEKYRGQQYTWMGIDELSQIPDYMWLSKLMGSLRTTDPNLKTYFRATTNWTGIGVDWVKEYFKVPHNEGKTIREKSVIKFEGREIETVVTKKWFNSTVFNNPALAQDIAYLAFLNSQPPHIRKAWLYGDTDCIEGAAFSEFDKDIHTCEPFEVPLTWKRFRGADYGYRDGAACVWVAVDPAFGTHYVYREFVVNGRNSEKSYTAPEFAVAIRDAEAGEIIRYGVLDSSVWANRGDSGPSLAEQMLAADRYGARWRPADKGNGSRVAGKNKIHQLLQVDEKTNKPGLVFFKNVPHCIKMMQGIPLDGSNAEDVDSDSPLDHQYDALRYVVMSRPHTYGAYRDKGPPPPINTQFGF